MRTIVLEGDAKRQFSGAAARASEYEFNGTPSVSVTMVYTTSPSQVHCSDMKYEGCCENIGKRIIKFVGKNLPSASHAGTYLLGFFRTQFLAAFGTSASHDLSHGEGGHQCKRSNLHRCMLLFVVVVPMMLQNKFAICINFL